MAKALASPSYEKDFQEVNHFESDYNSDNDSEADEDETEVSHHSRSPKSQSSQGHSPGHSPIKDVHSRNTPESQQNGTVTMQVDRYGFVGGKEFTDPDEYVLNLLFNVLVFFFYSELENNFSKLGQQSIFCPCSNWLGHSAYHS